MNDSNRKTRNAIHIRTMSALNCAGYIHTHSHHEGVSFNSFNLNLPKDIFILTF